MITNRLLCRDGLMSRLRELGKMWTCQEAPGEASGNQPQHSFVCGRTGEASGNQPRNSFACGRTMEALGRSAGHETKVEKCKKEQIPKPVRLIQRDQDLPSRDYILKPARLIQRDQDLPSRDYILKPVRLILREKDLSPEEYRGLAQEVVRFCLEQGILPTLHTHMEVSEELSCPSVHLPFPVFAGKIEEIRQRKKTGSLKEVGVSVHSLEEAVFAAQYGGDYLIAGHIFATDCKKGLSPRGVSWLETICANVPLPVYAVGGIGPSDREKIRQCKEAGAAGVCVMSGYL